MKSSAPLVDGAIPKSLPLILLAVLYLVMEPVCAAAVLTTVMVSLTGTVDGPPESVVFSGKAQIKAKVAVDPDAEASTNVLLAIDLSKVVGIGSLSGKTYLTTTQEILNRTLTAADLFEITFNFSQSGQHDAAARVGLASFNLGFDMDTGRLTGASGEVSPLGFPESDEHESDMREDDSETPGASSSKGLP